MKTGENNKIVITYGTFDCFHYGHLLLLKKAKAMGCKLIVGLSTDQFNQIKGKKSFFSFEERKSMLEEIKLIDEIIPEMSWEQKESDIENFKIDIFAIGDDWRGKFDSLKKYCEVIYLPRTNGISSTLIKSSLQKNI